MGSEGTDNEFGLEHSDFREAKVASLILPRNKDEEGLLDSVNDGALLPFVGCNKSREPGCDPLDIGEVGERSSLLDSVMSCLDRSVSLSVIWSAERVWKRGGTPKENCGDVDESEGLLETFFGRPKAVTSNVDG